MQPFAFEKAANAANAIARAGDGRASRYLGGGTNLVDLMRENIERPERVIDVTGLNNAIEVRPDGSILVGAGVKNTALAEHEAIRRNHPLVARAILAGASAQIRNMATVGGNLVQRTRCYYFYDEAARCNKRQPGAGCDARHGFNRIHAVLGASEQCVATHPSDLCVALSALDAVVHLQGPAGARSVPIGEFHRLPGNTPEIESVLGPAELITAVELPAVAATSRVAYRKVRDRASYAFALVSVAATLDVTDGHVTAVRLALGGVAHKPWRATRAETLMIGQPATQETFMAAADAELEPAAPLRHNAFKVELATRAINTVLTGLAR